METNSFGSPIFIYQWMSPNFSENEVHILQNRQSNVFLFFFLFFLAKRLVPDFFLFFKKALNEVKAIGIQLSFNIF